MDRQRAEARRAWAGSGEAATETVWYALRERVGATDFLGYETETAEGVVAGADLDWADAERVGFALTNVVDALAPSNSPVLNPAALKAVIDTAGGSALAGLRHFVTDMAAPPRVPSMVEPDAFEVVGQPVRADRNNVDLDREMLKLGETSFGYSVIAQLLKGKFRTLASAINEGRTS